MKRARGKAALGLGLIFAGVASFTSGGRAAQAPPTPLPLPVLGPASVPTTLPYPAYGPTAAGVMSTVVEPGVPQVVTLAQAIQIAFARAPALASARADVEVAAAAVRLQQAGLLPNISGSVSHGRAIGQAGAPSSSSSSSPFVSSRSADTTSTSLSASLRQLIFDGGKVAAGIRAARSNESAQSDNYRRALQTVALNVAQAYYNALAAQRTTAVAVEVVKQDTVEQNLVQAQANAGTVPRADVATAALPVAQGKLALVQAQGAELSAQSALANAIGLDANTNILPADDTPIFTKQTIQTIAIPTYAQAIARAVAMRPDADAAAQSLAAAGASLSAAKRGFLPTLSGSASTGTSSTDATGGTFRNSSQLGLQLSIPIYDQGITQANVSQAQANVEKATASVATTRITIQLNVKQALVSLISARAAVDQANAEYVEALSVTQSTQAQYRAGVTTLPLLLNAEVGLTTALADQVKTAYALRQAEQAFLYAEGENDVQPARGALVNILGRLPSTSAPAARPKVHS